MCNVAHEGINGQQERLKDTHKGVSKDSIELDQIVDFILVSPYLCRGALIWKIFLIIDLGQKIHPNQCL